RNSITLTCIPIHSACSAYPCTLKFIFAARPEQAALAAPGSSVKTGLDSFSCRLLVTREQIVKWCDLMCRSALSGVDSCYCPFPNCSGLVLNDCRDKLKKTNCPYCNRTFCFQCGVPWHVRNRCSESGNLRDRNDILVGELIERKMWTRCYHCGHSVERVGGCGSIKCLYVLLSFATICGIKVRRRGGTKFLSWFTHNLWLVQSS
ncbi:hypothetical protein Tsubulata_034091, partial [Turnera subulata]